MGGKFYRNTHSVPFPEFAPKRPDHHGGIETFAFQVSVRIPDQPYH